jgi:hypothetical protein
MLKDEKYQTKFNFQSTDIHICLSGCAPSQNLWWYYTIWNAMSAIQLPKH